MDTPVCQRWRDQRGVYRLAREPFDPRRCEVEETKSDNLARGFVEQHHYSGSYVAARFRFALHEAGALVGMAVFSTPMNDRSLAPFDRSEAVELGRLVLLDSVKANAESWFVARCFEQLRAKGLRGVVSFSDPEQRTDARGAVVLAGHIGTVYQGLNAIYKGRSKARVLRLLPDGTTLNERAMSKIRKRECGWRYAVDQLVEHGASAPEGDLDRWLPRALAQVTRPLRHGGNHRYLWALTPSHHARLLKRTDRLPYPKFSIARSTMKILPVVYKFLPMLMPDGTIHRVAFQVYQINGEAQIRIGNNKLMFNKDGTFDGCEAKLPGELVPEYSAALEEPRKNIPPDDTYHQPGTPGYRAEMNGRIHHQDGDEGQQYGVAFKKDGGQRLPTPGPGRPSNRLAGPSAVAAQLIFGARKEVLVDAHRGHPVDLGLVGVLPEAPALLVERPGHQRGLHVVVGHPQVVREGLGAHPRLPPPDAGVDDDATLLCLDALEAGPDPGLHNLLGHPHVAPLLAVEGDGQVEAAGLAEHQRGLLERVSAGAEEQVAPHQDASVAGFLKILAGRLVEVRQAVCDARPGVLDARGGGAAPVVFGQAALVSRHVDAHDSVVHGPSMGALDKPYKVIKFKNVQAISMQEGLFPAEPHHLDALVELDAKCFMPSSREETTTWRNQMAQTQVFLVRGKVIGAVVVHQNELHSLAVDPDHQRMGYGVVLVQKAIGQGASRLWVREQNQRAEALYKKCGFVRSSKVKTEDGTQFFEMVLSYSHLQPAAHIHGQPLQG